MHLRDRSLTPSAKVFVEHAVATEKAYSDLGKVAQPDR
jgi:hypothetical protein